MERFQSIGSSDRLQMVTDYSRFADCTAVLLEMFELLEAYAPTWYTEDHHRRATAALGSLLLKPKVL